MLFETNRDKGRAGMAIGIAWFGANGYTVNIPLNDTQWYDFVAEKDGKFYTVQCKATGADGNRLSLRTCGGVHRHIVGTVIDYPLDYLFCIDAEQHMYLIPVPELAKKGNVSAITLRTKPANNNQGFPTEKYLVEL